MSTLLHLLPGFSLSLSTLRKMKQPSPEASDMPPDPPPEGSFRCCQCDIVNDVYFSTGKNPLGIVSCQCHHVACEACFLFGRIANFAPITEPLLVPVSEADLKQIPFGIVCSDCGMSWRAEGVRCLKKKPSLLAPPQRPPSENGSLKKSKSMTFASSSTKKTKAPEATSENAHIKAVTIRFYGKKCICGEVSNSQTMGFKILETAKDEPAFKKIKPYKAPERFTTPELLEKGHHSPMIRLWGKEHPNPLRSCPVGPNTIAEEEE
ncbi:hypothetical protein EJ04DRAFT_572188 [Polyplosphaeria fusca]|uniref:Probable double zinc ribbon domain-containing protein n=1 Tax=Polyplosphaeria fusca TaxID=682080 RepID=A0A9P4R796_9PLEO|nr:hypothetical protein EJ04DRAFT_572188 [Polyplosphaeria fusca]